MLYASLPRSAVIAVDMRTGRVLWRYHAKVAHEWGFRACCDVVNCDVA